MVVVMVARIRMMHQRKPSDFQLSSSRSNNCKSKGYLITLVSLFGFFLFVFSVIFSIFMITWTSCLSIWGLVKSKMSLSDLEQGGDSTMNIHDGGLHSFQWTNRKNLEYINLRSSPLRSLEPKQASKSLMSPDLVDKHWRRLKEHMFQKRLIDILIEKY